MTMEQYWRDYSFLTNEIEKCLLRQDFDMVHELLAQREKFQTMIEDSNDDGFKASEEGKKLLTGIAAKNRTIIQMLHMLRNRMQKKHAIANAYDKLGMSNTGSRMDSRS